MEMRRPANDNDLVQLKVNLQTTQDRADDIDLEASEYRIMKVKCLAVQAVRGDLTASTAVIGHATASLDQNAEVRATNMQNLPHLSIRANNGWKCNVNKRKLPIWEQCKRLQW
jgi:hypothetical protein